MLSVFIVDDHAILREGLKSLLKSARNIRVVGEASNGADALPLIERLKPDITILDISMPGLSGFQLIDEIGRRNIATKIILLTMLNDPGTISQAIKLNIHGFVPKENVFDDLLYAIKAAETGQQFISPSVTKSLHEHLEKRAAALTKLSAREQEVLGLIVDGLTSRQIAEKLFISPNTVENHRERIMQKLDIHKNVDLVKYALSHNLARMAVK